MDSAIKLRALVGGGGGGGVKMDRQDSPFVECRFDLTFCPSNTVCYNVSHVEIGLHGK